MKREVLQSIENIGVFPVTSFVIFFAAFCLVLLWVITYDKKTINAIENLPLNSNNSFEPTENLKP
jgi:cytochrome c oxidase cbb3-type subunit 4